MIGAHGYATQELVNLMLVGRAWSNTIDGTKSFGGADEGTDKDKDKDKGKEMAEKKQKESGVVLHGPHRRSSIGFLSLHEHYGSVLVGARLKDPARPVWVISSESHYTCAWVSCPHLGASPAPPGGECRWDMPVDLHYWDGLVGQDEEIMFSLEDDEKKKEVAASRGKSASHSGAPSSFSVAGILGLDDAPPLELVLKTRWKGAAVDWNGVQPWL